MIIDAELRFSEEQAVTVTATSTKVLDFTTMGASIGAPLNLIVSVTDNFVGSGTLQVGIESSDNETFASAETLVQSGSLATEKLTAGAIAFRVPLPYGTKRYLRVKYTVTGSAFSDGEVTTFLTEDKGHYHG